MAPIEHEIPDGTYQITLVFGPSTDEVITCIVCGQDGCDLECTVRDVRNSRITIGKHSRCIWRMLAVSDRPTCETCGEPIPVGGEGVPEICPDCIDGEE